MANKNEQLTLIINERPNIYSAIGGKRYKAYIARGGSFFHLASFNCLAGLREFIKKFGLHLEYIETIDTDKLPEEYRVGKSKRYKVKERFHDEIYFWDIKSVPSGAHATKLLSNGSIVTGYWIRKDNTIHIYRPNPNAKEVYKPMMSIDEEIEFQQTRYVF